MTFKKQRLAEESSLTDLEMDFPITVVFILSASRSGSTWLNLVLGSSSWALNLGEYHRPWDLPGDRGSSCFMCAADGLPDCSLLHGIEHISKRNCFHFASYRSGKRIIIDSSKILDWCSTFLNDDRITKRFIHLVRHPSGYVESDSRRAPHLSHDELLDQWEFENKRISEFTTRYLDSSTLACYDALADEPSTYFPKICSFIGHLWEPEALLYWKFPHHEFAGNGAASVYLRGRKEAFFVTGDDAYYEKISARNVSADTRFRERLSLEFRSKAVAKPYSQRLMRELGVQWLP